MRTAAFVLFAFVSAATAAEPAGPDFLALSLIPSDVKVDLKADLVRYRLIGTKKPIRDLPKGTQQTPDRKSPTVIELEVRKTAYPKTAQTIPVAAGKDLAVYLEANHYLESDADLIVKLAKDAVGKETNILEACKKLEKFVARYVDKKNLATAFATARQTAESRSGDCTEHACLLAAMARAVGIPSRVVGGIVYADQFVGNKQLFAYHMWCEMHFEGEWYPFDGALHPRGGFEVGHIALVSNDMGAVSAELQLGVGLMNAIGNLKIEVIEQKKSAPAPKK